MDGEDLFCPDYGNNSVSTGRMLEDGELENTTMLFPQPERIVQSRGRSPEKSSDQQQRKRRISPIVIKKADLAFEKLTNGKTKCTICNELFSSRRNMKRHWDQKHEKKIRMFKCSDCPRKNIRLDDVIRHGKNIHGWCNEKCDDERDRINMRSFKVDNNTYKSPKGKKMDIDGENESFETKKVCTETEKEKAPQNEDLFPGNLNEDPVTESYFLNHLPKHHPTITSTPFVAPQKENIPITLEESKKKLHSKIKTRDALIREVDELQVSTQRLCLLEVRKQNSGEERIKVLEAENKRLWRENYHLRSTIAIISSQAPLSSQVPQF